MCMLIYSSSGGSLNDSKRFLMYLYSISNSNNNGNNNVNNNSSNSYSKSIAPYTLEN